MLKGNGFLSHLSQRAKAATLLVAVLGICVGTAMLTAGVSSSQTIVTQDPALEEHQVSVDERELLAGMMTAAQEDEALSEDAPAVDPSADATTEDGGGYRELALVDYASSGELQGVIDELSDETSTVGQLFRQLASLITNTDGEGLLNDATSFLKEMQVRLCADDEGLVYADVSRGEHEAWLRVPARMVDGKLVWDFGDMGDDLLASLDIDFERDFSAPSDDTIPEM